MNVFLPFKKDTNLILDEIEQCFDGKFIYGHYSCYDNNKIDIVNIHWPEKIFNFSIPTEENLCELEEALIHWKKKSKVIYTRHNTLPHGNVSPNFLKLYELIIKYADGIIHLGNYSLNEFNLSHPTYADKKMAIISHPAYTLFKNEVSKSDARKKLNIPLDKKVILVFGSIRKNEELDLILDSFNSLKEEQKFLLISNLNIKKPLPKGLAQRGKKFISAKIEQSKFKLLKNVQVNYGHIENDDVQIYLNAADLLFVSRIDLLNSGNVYLGFSFKKIVVGPNIGNISEVLKETNNPIYNPKDKMSVLKAIEQGLTLGKTKENENYNFVMEKCQPLSIAKSYYKFFEEL